MKLKLVKICTGLIFVVMFVWVVRTGSAVTRYFLADSPPERPATLKSPTRRPSVNSQGLLRARRQSLRNATSLSAITSKRVTQMPQRIDLVNRGSSENLSPKNEEISFTKKTVVAAKSVVPLAISKLNTDGR